MTNEDAIELLEHTVVIDIDDARKKKKYEAIRMGVNALKAQKADKWDVESDCEGKTRTLIHKECGFKSNPYVWKNYNFCPECGARMESVK